MSGTNTTRQNSYTPVTYDPQYILMVNNLKKYFPIKGGMVSRTVGHVKAVDGVTFNLKRGSTMGLVGESGCGKTTTGRTILRLSGEKTDGQVLFNGKEVYDLTPKEMRSVRTKMQIIFQDPFSSLSPRLPVGEIIGEAVREHGLVSKAEFDDYIDQVMDNCGLQPFHKDRYPHEFSGGQRQRICIARALALNPEFVVCDEPVSALDVSIQAQIINLLKDLQINLGLTYVFISHDLSVVKYITDQVLVMYLGNAMEQGNTEEIFKNPLHPYTKALFSALPVPNPNVKMNRIILEGDIPSPANPPEGCKFHTRCSHCMKACKYKAPEYTEAEPDHFVACHLYNKEIMENLAFYDEEYDNLLIRRQAEEEEQRRKKENGKFYRFKTRLFGFFGTVKAKVCGLFTRKKADGTGSDGKKTADSGEKRKQEAEKEENESEIR